MPLLLVAAGCASTDKPTQVASPPLAPGPSALAPAISQPESSAQCREYQALLLRLSKESGHFLSGRSGAENFLGLRYDKLPVVGGGHPVGGADEDDTDAALLLGEPSTYQRGGAPPPRGAQTFVYVAAEKSVPAAEVEKLIAGSAKGKELRLLVLRSEEELMAQLVLAFPRTPASLKGRLGRPLHLETHGALLVQLSRPCPLGHAFGSIERGGGFDVLFPAVAQALEACQCDLEDLDAFVSLLAFADMPWADGAYFVVDAHTLAGLAAGATVTDLAQALAKSAAK